MHKRGRIARIKELEDSLRHKVGSLNISLSATGMVIRDEIPNAPASYPPMSYLYLSDDNAIKLRDYLNEEYPDDRI